MTQIRAEHRDRPGRRKRWGNQLARLDRRIAAFEIQNQRFSLARLAVFSIALVAVFTAFQTLGSGFGLATAGAGLLAFAEVVRRHRRLDEMVRRHRIAREHKRQMIARLDLDWPRIPLHSAVPEPDHPFGADLQIGGPRSVHQLVDTAASRGGSRRLLGWLLETEPDLERTYRRQDMVRALVDRPGFRSRLGLNSALASQSAEPWDGEALLRWIHRQRDESSLLRLLLALGLLGAVNLVFFVLFILGLVPVYALLGFGLYALLNLSRMSTLGGLFDQAYEINRTLAKFRAVFGFLESYPVPPVIQWLCAPFAGATKRPSRLLRRVGWVLSAASLQRNPAAWFLVNLFFPWDFFFAYQLEGTKKQLRNLLPTWLEAWYELEALASLANFADSQEGICFPDLVAENAARVLAARQPLLQARDIGHPLIPAGSRVCNDLCIDALGGIHLITGSNMSGKSTFLRTAGVNLVLALAGGPVVASQFSGGLFRIFTSIQLSDSLADGISYFYAEVKRLKALLDELGSDHPYPLLYLIDEIYRGTNNIERLTGSRAYLRKLIGQQGFGLIATHDLELAGLDQEFPQISNFHFKETIHEGKMVFDFKLQPDPCPTTNALHIMESAGLPVR